MRISCTRIVRFLSGAILAATLVVARSAMAQLPDTLDLRLARAVAHFDNASAIDADPSEIFYVTDRGRDIVVRLNNSGAVLSTWGGPGANNQSLDDPASIDATNGLRILVADEGNGRIQWFTNDGIFVGSVPLITPDNGTESRTGAIGNRGRPVAVVSDNENQFFVLDGDSGQLLVWDNSRSLKRLVDPRAPGQQQIGRPVALTTDGNRLFIADAVTKSIFLFDRIGTFERTFCSNQCAAVRSLTVSGDRLIVVMENAVRVYYLHGLLDSETTILSSAPVVGIERVREGWFVLTQKSLFGPF